MERKWLVFIEFGIVADTPFLFILGWLSLYYRGQSWAHIGLSPPNHFIRMVVLGVSLGVASQFFGIYVKEPLIERLTHSSQDLSQFAVLQGNFKLLMMFILLSWALAAFGEELFYRGYLMNRLAELAGCNRSGWGFALLLSSLVFGAGHLYQGMNGVIDAFFNGLLFGVLYLMSRRNLWLPIIAHGVTNTLGLIFLYLGWFI